MTDRDLSLFKSSSNTPSLIFRDRTTFVLSLGGKVMLIHGITAFWEGGLFGGVRFNTFM